jgi:hypothetical protein
VGIQKCNRGGLYGDRIKPSGIIMFDIKKKIPRKGKMRSNDKLLST